MKTLRLLVIGVILFLASSMQAQITVGVRIGPPEWGPYGYSDARYYYIPDIEAYYDVQAGMFIYLDGGAWVHRGYLPARYRDYDLYGGYKVVMTDYHGNTPYTHFNEHRTRYARGYHHEGQRTVGERPGRRDHDAKVSHEERHENREAVHNNERRTEHGNDKKVEQHNEKGNSHDNGKNNKEEHEHNEGHDKR